MIIFAEHSLAARCERMHIQSNEKRHCKLNQVRCKLKQFTKETNVNRFSCNVNSNS